MKNKVWLKPFIIQQNSPPAKAGGNSKAEGNSKAGKNKIARLNRMNNLLNRDFGLRDKTAQR